MTQGPAYMASPPEAYQLRRAKLAAALNDPMVLFAGQARARNYPTNLHPFRAGSSYLYFGGPSVPGAALVIEPNSDGSSGCTLARPVVGFEDIVWTGPPDRDEDLASVSGLDCSSFIAPDALRRTLGDRVASYIGPPCPSTLGWAEELGLRAAEPAEFVPIVEMRLIKDEHELEAMRRAAKVGVEAHLAAMKAAAPGRSEAQVVAAFHEVLIANQCQPSFSPIVSVHGEIFHTEGYPNMLEKGDLLLVDGGAEAIDGYTSDITRTYPVDGRFTSIQRELYEVVLRSQRAAIAACVPGKRYRDVHDLSARIICEGLVGVGLLRGDPDELTRRLAHTLFYGHGVGHLIGLDVHDLEDFGDYAGYAPGRNRRPEFGNKYLRLDRDLVPGMTVTIEPGIYFSRAVWENEELTGPLEDVVNRPAVDALLNDGFGGLRLEEDICVRSDGGPEVLTSALPIDAEEVAAIVSG